MFAQIIDADAHQFGGVQRAAARFRIACGMTGNAVEPEITLNAGLMGTGRYDVERGWMPGDRCIGVREEPVACQIGFAAAAFLSRTADHFDRSRQLVLFQIVFNDHRGGNRADA